MDSSALSKLHLEEQDTPKMRQAVRSSLAAATSILTFAELRAALARGRRTGRLTVDTYDEAVASFEAQWPNYQAIRLDEELVRTAGQLAEKHDLSGSDAVQLASGIELASSAGSPVVFATWDRRLWRAGKTEGFDVLPESAP